MPDLYAALDIQPDADRATIRRAYRKRAKSAHPDAGGSREKFALVTLAHDTLTDDARRARYDQTGEAEDNPVDNRNAQLLEMLATGLDAAMAKVMKRAAKPTSTDMAKLVRQEIRDLRRTWDDERNQFHAGAERWRDMLERWTGDLMKAILIQRVKACEAHVKVLADRIGVADRAIEVLSSETFRFDPEPEPQGWTGGAVSFNLADLMGASG